MGPAVGFQNLVVEIFDAQAQTSDAQVFQGDNFMLLQSSRLTFKGNFLNSGPGNGLLHAIEQSA